MSRIAVLLAALMLSGCSLFGQPAPATSINMPGPPVEWKKPAEALPPLPKCGHLKSENARIECRAVYDTIVRRMYVDLALRHESLSGFIDRLGLQDNSWTVETNR